MGENRFGGKGSAGIMNEAGKLGSNNNTPAKNAVKKAFLIKLDPDFQEALAIHFAYKGLNFSAGVRMMLHEAAEENEIEINYRTEEQINKEKEADKKKKEEVPKKKVVKKTGTKK